MVLAWRRDRARRAFVAEVDAGRVPGLRVAALPEGPSLLRDAPPNEDPRVTDYAAAMEAFPREGSG
jgi:hypothetical protein